MEPRLQVGGVLIPGFGELSGLDLLNTGGIAGILLLMLILFVRGTIVPASLLKEMRDRDQQVLGQLTKQIGDAIENGLAKGIASAVQLARNPGHNPGDHAEAEEAEEAEEGEE